MRYIECKVFIWKKGAKRMKTKTLYIHIGTPKTGTTSIQRFCMGNSEALENRGYVYPIFPVTFPTVSQPRNGHFLIGVVKDEDGNRLEAEEKRIFLECMERVKDLLGVFDAVILSDESIWRSMDVERKNLLEALKEEAEKGGYQVRMIVYLRRQDDFICSLWNQIIKGKLCSVSEERFEDYLEKINLDIRLDYYEKLEKIAAVIGKENVIVRRFERDSFAGGSIYSDFLSAIGIPDMDGFSIQQDVRNLRLEGNMPEIKRALNGLPQMAQWETQEFFRSILRECSDISAKNYPCSMFSKEEAEEFLGRYQEGNRRIAREYLKEEGTELFDCTIKDTQKWQPDNPYMQEDLIRFIGAGDLILREELKSIREENKKLREELRRLENKINRLRHPLRTAASKLAAVGKTNE